MKIISLLLLALLPSSLAYNLRVNKHDDGDKIDAAALVPMMAPVEHNIPSLGNPKYAHRRLNDATINAAIAASLPTINSLMQAQITPDPGEF